MKLSTGLALLAALVAGPAAGATLEDGLSAYAANRVSEAERIYVQVSRDESAAPRVRASAYRELARIAWLIDADEAAAARGLAAAEAAGGELCTTGQLAGRVLRESGRLDEAVATARRLQPACDDPAELGQLRVELALALLELAERRPAQRATHLTAAREVLAALDETGRSTLSASAARLRAALLARDAAGALAAWRAYFWLPGDEDAPQAMGQWRGRVAAILSAGLEPGAAATAQAELADLLARAGFAAELRAFAADTGLARRAASLPAWRRAAAYLAYRDAVVSSTLALNRRLARGGDRSPDAWLARLQAATDLALERLGLRGDPREGLAAAFGLFATAGTTGGYPSAHAGHVVQDERRTIEQYGRRGEIRFVVLDNMIANGFESWLWDGRAAAGGWAEGGSTIVQVRQAYAGGPMKAWLLTHDTPARRRADAELPDLERRDRELLSRMPVGHLPGLQARLRRQAIMQIWNEAGGSGDERRLRFLGAYERAVAQHSIFIHEGRHVLDQASGEAFSGEELEYRAKLSELALADYPRLALANLDNETIGTDSPHGRANTRILAAYAAWLSEHAGAVQGIDRTSPLLAQLDRLSDDQIRAIARRLDPWGT